VAAENSAVAIGEIGLDFYVKDHNKQHQIDLVIEQLDIAIALDLPVILHVRKAHDVMFDLLKKHPVKAGVVHAFSGSMQQAQNYIKQGMALGIGGACTYPRASRLRKTIAELPLSSLVLETDAPDMPLFNQQGQRNSPESILTIAKTVAELRQQSIEKIATATTENCQRIFNL
jgi:TatD DNase family protein